MLHLGLFALGQTRLPKVDLILEFERAAFFEHPHDPANRRQGRHRFIHHRGKELARFDFRTAQFDHFLHETLNLELRALDRIVLRRGLR